MYTLRYGYINPKYIEDTVLILNPNYGNPIGKYGSRPLEPPIEHRQKLENQNGFYTKLEKSIQKEGIRNPILCTSLETGTYARYGTTRLLFAKKLGLAEIPCLIVDWADRWVYLEEISQGDINRIKALFKDPPEIIEFQHDEFIIDKCPHSHLLNL